MKFIIYSVLIIALMLTSTVSFTQNLNKPTTVIIIRHAEKATGDDPELTRAGKKRAKRLVKVFKNYMPDEFYTSNYKRTIATVKPWATSIGKDIKLYDPKNLNAFASELKQHQGKTVVVIGHSNTNPKLVNLLLDNNKYQLLADNDYGTVFIVTINGDTTTDTIKKY